MPKLNSTKNTRRKYVPEKEVENKNMSFYNSKAWRATSSMYRKDNPLCESCTSKGITTAAAHTDHVISIEQGGHKYDIDNLMSLCISCHSVKTQVEKEGILIEYKGTFGQFVPVDKSSIFKKVGGT